MRLVTILTVIALQVAITPATPVIDSRPPCTSGKLDLVIVVDVSGSVEQRFNTNRDFAWELAHAMPIGNDRVLIAIVQYSRLAITKIDFFQSQTWEAVNDTIFNLEWTGDVALTAEAMDLAMINFRRSRPDAQRAIVLISDGNSYNKWKDVLDTADRLKYSDAKIHAIAMGGNAYDTELKVYVGVSNGTIVHRQSEFEQLKRELLQYTVASCRGGALVPPSASAPKRVPGPPSFKPTSSEETSGLFSSGETTSTTGLPDDRTTVKASITTRAHPRFTNRKTSIRTRPTAVVSTTLTTPLPPAGAPERFIDKKQ